MSVDAPLFGDHSRTAHTSPLTHCKSFRAISCGRLYVVFIFFASVFLSISVFAGGNIAGQWFTPMGSGAPRSSGDFVSAASGGGLNTFYIYYIEVTPGTTRLDVDLFDADTGGGALEQAQNYSENLDRRRGFSWNTSTRYRLYNPAGTSVRNQLVGAVAARHNAWWSFYGTNNPMPGHWRLTVDMSSAQTSGDDLNSYGVRAHDGTPGPGGREINIYAPTYLQIGTHDTDNNPNSGDSRTVQFHPYVTELCSVEVNDFDADSLDTGPFTNNFNFNTRIGQNFGITETQMSGDNNWANNPLTGWTRDVWAGDYGIWSGSMTIFERVSAGGNYSTFYGGTPRASNPPPTAEPEANSIRFYLPTDSGTAPVKPYMMQMVSHVSGPNPPLVGQTSTFRIDIYFENPTAYPIVFTSPAQGIGARIPAAAEVVYADNATVSQGSIRIEPPVGGSGVTVWDPGTIAAGDIGYWTYDVDVTPSSAGQRVEVTEVNLTQAVMGTMAVYTDETGDTRPIATHTFGPLCNLAVTENGDIVPTCVTLAGIKAVEEGNRTVVEWETASEINTVGFHLLRLEKKDDKERYVKVSDRLVPALRHAPQGGTYRLVDPDAKAGETHSYKLEEIEEGGKKRTYGPFTVTVRGDSGGGSVAKVADEKSPQSPTAKAKHSEPKFTRAERPVSPSKKSRLDAAHALRELTKSRTSDRGKGPAAKIAVVKDGIHFLSAAEIASALNVEEDVGRLIETRRLRLTKQGNDVPYLPAPDNSGIYFYADRLDSLYSDENIYWLRPGHAGGMKTTRGKVRGPAAESQTFVEVLHLEEDHYPFITLPDDPEDDYWFWDFCMADAPGMETRSFTFRTDGLAPGRATLKVHLQGAVDDEANPDHHAVLRLNGTTLGEVQWDGTAARTASVSVDTALLNDGENTLEVQAILDGDVFYSVFYVDSFDVSYRRRYTAVNDALLCRGDGHEVVTVSGFSNPAIYVFELNDAPKNVKLVKDTVIDFLGGSHRVSFKPASPQTPYAVWSPLAASSPASIVADAPSDIKHTDDGADYLIIAPSELKDAIQPLADYRQGHGLMTMVVDLEDVYDEFNHGIANPNAIRAMLSHACRKWRRPPMYVLLVGEGTYDYRNRLGYGDCNLMPPIMVRTAFGLFESDNRYADLEGDDGVPEVAIGRLPVTSVAELERMIGKIIAQETGTGDWRSRVMLVADDPDDGGAFPTDSDALARLVPDGFATDKVYLLGGNLAETRQRVVEGINNGTMLFNFMGHGAPDRFAAEPILSVANVASLNNPDRPAVVTSFTCGAARFALPGFDCLAEALLLADGGAVAVWGPGGYAWHTQQNVLAQALFEEAFGPDRPVLGDAVRRALTAYAAQQGDMDTIKGFNLLGDPAQRLFGDRATGGGGAPIARASHAPSPSEGGIARSLAKPGHEEPDSSSTLSAEKTAERTTTEVRAESSIVGGSITTMGSPEGRAIAPGITVAEEDAGGMVLEICPPAPRRVSAGGNGERLDIAGYGHGDDPGAPLLPRRTFPIPLPEGKRAGVTVLSAETEEIENIAIAPAPRWVVRDLAGGKSRLAEKGKWALVPEAVTPSAVYSQDELWPPTIVRVEEGGRMGGQDLAFLTVTPVTYNPVAKQAVFHKRIRVRLAFEPRAQQPRNPVDVASYVWRPDGEAVKLRTSRSGMVRVSVASLRKAGFGASGDPRRLAMFHHGREVPIYVQGESSGKLTTKDFIEFLVPPASEPTARERVFWLVAGRGRGRRMAEGDATPPADGAPAKIGTATVVLDAPEQVLFVDETLPLAERWILAEIDPGETRGFAVNLPAPDTSLGGRLSITAGGGAVSASVNGRPVGDGVDLPLPPGALSYGQNTITLQNTGAEPLVVKRIAVTCTPNVRVARPGLRMRVEESGVLTLGNLTKPLAAVYDVTGDAPVRLVNIANVPEGDMWTARLAVLPGHAYQIADPSSENDLDVKLDRPSALFTGRGGADYVIITHALFEAEAKRLALHRTTQGRRAVVVDVEDVFDEFSFGERDPAAIHRFLAHAYHTWSPGVRQAVLLGDGAICSGSDGDLIPAHVEQIGPLATASDSWFGCVDGDDLLPDVAVGRLPVRNLAEARAVVQKLIQHDLKPAGAILAVTGPGRIDGAGDGLPTVRSDTILLVSVEAPHGYYHSPTIRSLGETLLCGQEGVIGCVVNSGLLNEGDAALVAETVAHAAASGPDPNLGGLLDVSRLLLAGRNGWPTALRACLLLGDPAAVLRTPPPTESLSGTRTARKDDGASPQAAAPDAWGEDSPYALIWQVLAPKARTGAGAVGHPSGTPSIVVKATMVDAAASSSIVQDASGRQRLVRVGDRIDGAEIVAIRSGGIVVRFDGLELEIEIARK
ncbi:MAG: C25 family cysteine peptidase [Planctomycetota bacterium]